jgi:hypothetical protein
MRKIVFVLSLGLALLACSVSDLGQLVPLAPTQPLAASPTPFPTWTHTPDVPPTYTYTPTLIGQEPSPTITETGTITPTASITPTGSPGSPMPTNTIPGPAISPTIIPGNTGFDMILVTHTQFYYGSCTPNDVQFEVLVNKPDKVESVVLFLKLRNKVSGDETNWSRGTAMNRAGDGRYVYVLASSKLAEPAAPSWVVYQVVGTDDEQEIVARSPVFSESLTLVKCPLPGGLPSPTQPSLTSTP